ncbi:prolyl oligopeptidase family serine peptidase [Flavobacterium endoglycinae]|uniref:Prolyl oligopeptidase family serine peptidase n=1 Tax=Flavobacterium endoglycinae TaxID=2816357 RepID=A0ABX7QIW4_9FLAO|nr:prolyl oligopeptidase family serine peptidase [Flavobacterium endoglycinae]QSW90625.1 prolyl oligopeptidase family serine peptidase [Flavobacterium endoglycinae]
MKRYFLFLWLVCYSSFSQTNYFPHLAYGKSSQQILDLYVPKGSLKDVPVVILIHGGSWSMGGLEYTQKHAQDIANKGFVVANVDYRYINDTISAKDLLADIDAAITYVSKNSSKYGYVKKGYHIVGISAGAHLSLLYGYTYKNIKSITALCAPSRLDSPEVLEFMKKNGRLDIIEKLAGTRIDSSGDNSALTMISPFSNISNIPTLLIHGDTDNIVNVSQSQNLYNELKRKGVETKLIIREGKGHDVGMNTPDTEIQNIKDITEWITQHNK